MGKIYNEYRPSYPREFIEYLHSGLGMNKNSVAADIGSGTGKLTRALLERGAKVFAVEPNADMRAVAEADLSGFENFISVNATAENTTLEENGADFITVAQAFHWFDRLKFKAECRRILKPGGKVVLVWNSRDEKSALVGENDALNHKYCRDFKGFSGGMRGAENKDSFNDFFEKSCEEKIFMNDLLFDEQGFIGRNLSSSYAPKETDENYQPYIAELKALFKKHAKDGKLAMPNITKSYAGNV